MGAGMAKLNCRSYTIARMLGQGAQLRDLVATFGMPVHRASELVTRFQQRKAAKRKRSAPPGGMTYAQRIAKPKPRNDVPTVIREYLHMLDQDAQ